MVVSLFLAKIFGLIYLIVGLGFILNKDHYEAVFKDFMSSPALMYFGGVMSLVTGFIIIQVHNKWVGDWTILITMIGWMAFLKGVTILTRPRRMQLMAEYWTNRMQTVSFISVALGAILCYHGFLVG